MISILAIHDYISILLLSYSSGDELLGSVLILRSIVSLNVVAHLHLEKRSI